MRNTTTFLMIFALSAPVLRAQTVFESGFENDLARADVVWSTETELITGDALDALQSYDPETGTFVFDSALLSGSGITLTPGEVLLVDQQGLGRIDTVNAAGGQTTVTTMPATLADAIESGNLRWQLDFGFDELAQSKVQFGEKSCSPSISGLTVSFECSFEDYTLTMQVTGGRTSSQVQFVIKKGGDNANASFTGTGTLSQFTQDADVRYSGGELEMTSINNEGLQLDIVLKLAAAGSGSSDARYSVPFPIFKIPFTVGPVPMSIDIGARALAILNVPASAQASATGEARFSYNGNTGLMYDGSTVELMAETNGVDFSDGSFDSAALFGINFVEATFGMAFPRVALSVFNNEVAYILVGPLLRSIYYTGPICKEARTEVIVQGGYGLSILGISLIDQTDQVLKRERLIVSTIDGVGQACPQSGI